MKLYVIGDSISIHYGPYLESFLQGVAGYARKTGEDGVLENLDIPRGANGGDSGQVLEFLREAAARGGIAADLLLFNCGLHDIKTDPASGARQVPLDRYEANLRTILRVIAELGPSPVWIRSTPFDEERHNRISTAFHRHAADLAAYNAAADAVMRAHGVPVIDLYSFTRNLGGDLYRDHVHFREDVRAQQAAFIAGWVSGYVNGRTRRTDDRPSRPGNNNRKNPD